MACTVQPLSFAKFPGLLTNWLSQCGGLERIYSCIVWTASLSHMTTVLSFLASTQREGSESGKATKLKGLSISFKAHMAQQNKLLLGMLHLSYQNAWFESVIKCLKAQIVWFLLHPVRDCWGHLK